MRVRFIAVNAVCAAIYIAVFIACYVLFLNRYYEGVGFALYPHGGAFVAGFVLIALVPVSCYRGVRAVSSTLSVLIYLVLYIPIICTFGLGSAQPSPEIVTVQLTFMAGMILIFASDAVLLAARMRSSFRFDLMPTVLVLTGISTAYVLFVYRGHFNFSGFGEELYTQRFANQDLGAGLVTRYVTSWLSTVLIPICIAYGLTSRRHRYTAAAIIACVTMYMAAANKISILTPLVIWMCFLATRRLPPFFRVACAGLSLLILALLLVAKPDSVAFLASAIVLNRTIGNGGQITVAYYDFFKFHPLTEYSHVGGLSAFTRIYPYGDLAIGQVVGQYYWSPLMNANANFWATDGIAAIGLPGILLVSAGCALLFGLINLVTRKHEQQFAILCFIPFVVTLLNQSLFSSIWSGGAVFLVIFFLVNRPATRRAASIAAASTVLPAAPRLRTARIGQTA